MNDDAYRRRLERDLDKWTQAGWIAPDGGPRILASLPPPSPGLSASTALGFAGAGLLGVAAIAFVMANWDGLPRFGRLGLVVALIAATIGGAIWAEGKRPQTQGALLLLAALFFAAGAGLVGQMYNIPGEPWVALALAAGAGLALSAAGDKAAPGIAGAVLAACAYGAFQGSGGHDLGPGEAALIAAFGAVAALALSQRKKPLIHIAIWFAAFTLFAVLARLLEGTAQGASIAAVVSMLAWCAAAAWGRFAPRPGAKTLYGYGAWFALSSFWIWGVVAELGLAHRAAAIVVGLVLLALGRTDRQGWVLAAGIVGTLGGIAVALADLGLDLMVAAGLFLVLAVGALGAAFAMARRGAAAKAARSAS